MEDPLGSSEESRARSCSEAGEQVSPKESVEKVTRKTDSLAVSEHPWESAVPEEMRLSPAISDSERYKEMIPDEYRTRGHQLNMHKVIEDLPSFLSKLSSTQLEDSTGEQSSRRKGEDSYQFEAQSVAGGSQASSSECPVARYIDCDGYCVESHVPDSSMQYFESRNGMVKRIKAGARESHRWVFTPSYCRASCGLFDWSEASEASEAGDLSETHQVVVVRPSQFQGYQGVCTSNSNLIVVSLPAEINGIGYVKNWILKLAGSLGLRYIWMMDDSILWFQEFNPENADKSQNVPFAKSFRILEEIAKETCLAALGPRVYDEPTQSKLKEPFTYKPPCGVVFLDLEQLRDERITYRSQLTILEDMVFGYECEKVGLRVCVSNRIHFYDMRSCLKTGAASSTTSPAGLTPPPPQQPSESQTSAQELEHQADPKKLFPET